MTTSGPDSEKYPALLRVHWGARRAEVARRCRRAKEGVEQPDGRRTMRRARNRQPGTELTGGRRGIRNTLVAYHPGGHPECPRGGISGDHKSA